LTTGYGVVLAQGSVHRALDYGAIRNDAKTPHPERLALIFRRMRELIRQFRPDLLALEGVFVSQNVQSALKLGQVRGAVMVAAAEEGVPVVELAPNAVKAAVTGHGHAEKAQVQFMVKAILGLPSIPKPHDAADALALAICALNRVPRDLPGPRP
jgi:crossover junction endodeoxyribonuclease RuvC